MSERPTRSSRDELSQPNDSDNRDPRPWQTPKVTRIILTRTFAGSGAFNEFPAMTISA